MANWQMPNQLWQTGTLRNIVFPVMGYFSFISFSTFHLQLFVTSFFAEGHV